MTAPAFYEAQSGKVDEIELRYGPDHENTTWKNVIVEVVIHSTLDCANQEAPSSMPSDSAPDCRSSVHPPAPTELFNSTIK
jgi:hypothetical protein